MAAALEIAILEVVELVVETGVNWLVQSTLLLAAGLALAWWLRERGSAAQSAVYRTTLVALFICPLATWGLSQLGFSGWSVRFSPGWLYAVSELEPASMPASAAVANESLPASPVDSPEPSPPSTFATNAEPLPPADVSSEPHSVPLPVAAFVANSKPVASLPVVDRSPAAPLVTMHGAGILAMTAVLIWAMICLLLLVRLAWAWQRIWQLRKRAHHDEWAWHLCRRLAEGFEVRPPDVLRSPFLPSPCLTGILRPAVVLPEADLELSLRDVLVHELAHLRRHDCHWNLARQLATAVCFFQPLMWVLSRRLEASAEEVCDDFVVEYGGDRANYAHRLVDTAELGSLRMAAAGVGIVSLHSMLARRVMRIMDTSRSLSTRVGNLLLAVIVLVGLGAALLAGFVGIGEQMAASNASVVATADGDGKQHNYGLGEESKDDDDLITVRGRIVDPAGAPQGNADVYALRWYWNFGKPAPLAKVKANADGRFEISYRKSQFSEPGGRPEQWREVYITAAAEGFGPGWIGYEDIESGREPVLRLAVDDVPVEGRVVDLEGNPVSGATIEVGEIMTGKDGDLSEWIEAIGAGQSLAAAASQLGDSLPLFVAGRWPGVVSDADGRFHMTGLGRERTIRLHVKHPSLVTSSIQVVTREMKPIAHPAYDFAGSHDNTVYGARFEFAAPPSRTIRGVVRDAETGEPIAGVSVWSDKFAGQNISGFHSIKVTSDEKGWYKLEGMPKGEGNRLVVVPTDLPYFTATKDVPDPPGMEPIEFDIELHHGVWVTGRVIDKATGRGVPSALMHYVPFPDNKRAAELPEFENNSHIMNVQDRYGTQADGSYRVVALPGRGIVAVNTVRDPYPSAQGYKEIEEVKDREGFMKYGSAFAPSEKFPTAVKEVNIEADDTEVVCNFALDPGRRVKLRAIANSGAPLTEVKIAGARKIGDHYKDFFAGDIEISALRDDERRTVLVYHPERRLGKALHVDAKQAEDGPITVQLERCATIKGRLVDGNRAPVNGAHIRVAIFRDGDYGQQLASTATDGEGRFTHEGLLPGLPYAIYAESSREFRFSVVAEKLDVGPGETIDLGEVDVTSEKRSEPKRVTPATAAAAPKEAPANGKLLTYTGRVVAPEGKPAVGARLYLPQNWAWSEEAKNIKPRAVTDADGKFRFTLDPKAAGRGRDDWDPGMLIAVADGYGMAWAPSALYETSGTMLSRARARLASTPTTWRKLMGDVFQASGQPLRLAVDDEPIRGRVVDINGQAVAGAKLALREVYAAPEEDLTAWVAATKKPQADFYSVRSATPMMINGPTVEALLPPAVTDADGRFTIRGIGRQRIAQFMVSGRGLQMERFCARTQMGETIEIPKEFRAPRIGKETYYSTELTYVAGPSKPIVGVVRDRATKEPLAGVLILSQKRHGHAIHGWGEDFVRTKTDAEGRYRLEGMPIGDDNEIGAVPQGEAPYMPMSVDVSTDGPASEIELDFDLPRGVWITGRVTDRKSGEGVVGEVAYFMFPDNEFVKDTRGLGNVDLRGVHRSDSDGQFRIPGIPGRGIVAFQADDGQRYPRGAGAENIAGAKSDIGAPYFNTEPSYCMPDNYQIVKEINPTRDDSEATVNLVLNPQRTLRGRTVDSDGKPLSGVYTVGDSPSYGWRRKNSDAFEVLGYDPAVGRMVAFYYEERNLVGRVDLSGELSEELVVTLQPGGKVVGRLVDEAGTPMPNAWLSEWTPRNRRTEVRHGPGSTFPLAPNRVHSQSGQYFTDAEGRFEVSGLMPGQEYLLDAIDRGDRGSMGRVIGVLEKAIKVDPGQTLELGDVRLIDREEFEKRAGAAEKAATAAMKFRGSVTGVDGQPAAGVHVAVIARAPRPARGGEYPPQSQVLGEAATDKQGKFEISVTKEVDGRAPAFAVARAQGAALGWQRFTAETAPEEIALMLRKEAPIRGKLIDIDGQPATNVTINYEAAFVAMGEPMRSEPDGVWFDNPANLPAAWPPRVVTDDEGRFTLTHLAADHAVRLKLEGDDRVAPQEIMLNSGLPEQRGERDATYRSLVKNLKPGEEAVLTVAPAQVFEGTVRFEDTGKPAPHARVNIWASQQAVGGSMINVAGKADAEGRYRITPQPGVRFGVTAYPPDGVPYFANQSDDVTWNDADRTKMVDIELKRGVLVRGVVKDAESGKPIAGSSIQYEPQSSNPNRKEKQLFGWQGLQTSDNEGRFEIVVLPGAGTILGHGPRNEYLIEESTSQQIDNAKPGGSRVYAHFIKAIEPTADESPVELTIELRRGETVRGTLVDEQGASVDQALMVSWRNINALNLWWRGHSPEVVGGKFEMGGLAPGEEYQVHFLSAQRNLGATATVRADEPAPRIVLRPLGRAMIRFVDEPGQPVSGYPGEIHLVARPGEYRFNIEAMRAGKVSADHDFIGNIDQFHYPKVTDTEADEEGRLTLPALIPGATYWVMSNLQENGGVAKEFAGKSGETLDLGDVVVKSVEQ